MSGFYRRVIRPVLFTQDPETIHDWTIGGLGWISRHPVVAEGFHAFYASPQLPVEVLGMRFPNPVGLAAGMDKDGVAVPVWEAMGFGFAELGAVTWVPQPGNPKPRVIRLVPDEAILNRMGFNNDGAERVAERLGRWRVAGRWPDHPVGMNLGKSKVTPLGEAAEEYARSFRVLWRHVDFVVINVSSPNTPELRRLQDKEALDEILAAVQEVNEALAEQARRLVGSDEVLNGRLRRRTTTCPILVKVAPDLSYEALDDVLSLTERRQVAGIVATNTTIARPATSDPDRQRLYAEPGGLSGRPLRARSTEIVRHVHRQTRGRTPIIGVGGIHSVEDAWEKVVAGATLVQLYSGLVFEGPGLPKEIVRGLIERMRRDGFTRWEDAVGSAP